jgi:hypothetical protein
MNINDIGFGNITRHFQNTMKEGESAQMLQQAIKSGVIDRFIKSFPPPSNDSETVRKELEEMVRMSETAGPNTVKLCEDMEEDHYFFFSIFCEELGLEYDADEIEEFVKPYDGILNYVKLHFNRPRPAQLAYYLNIPLIPIINTDSQTPSYPSGHVLDFLIIIKRLSERHPQHRAKLIQLYKRIKDVRVTSGVHYPSDTKGSEQLFRLLKESGLL